MACQLGGVEAAGKGAGAACLAHLVEAAPAEFGLAFQLGEGAAGLRMIGAAPSQRGQVTLAPT